MEDDRSSMDETTSTSSSDGTMEFDETIADPIERLLQRGRRERLRELQKIQFGHRPVSSGQQREKLENLFDSTGEASTSNQGQRFRPDSIHLEVHGLCEQHRVTSMLRSVEFRQALEAIVTRHTQGTIVTQPPAGHPGQPPSQRPLQSTPSSEGFTPPSRALSTPRIPPPPPPPFSTISGRTQPAAIPRDPVTLVQPIQQIQNTATVPPPPPPPPLPAVPHMQPTNQAQPANSPPGPAVDWTPIQRESMVESIQALLHQHLVTSVLNSNFRNVLEIHIQERASQTGGGENVRQFVRNLATQFNHRRFRQASTGPQQSAAANSAHVSSHEITELRSEIDEIKRLVQVSFEMQLGIQRSIQQEVAAVFAAAMSGTLGSAHAAVGMNSGGQQAAQPRVTSPAEEGSCIICVDNATDTVLYRCGHMCVCHACGINLQMQGQHCPVCRAPIVDIIRAYKTT